jgi:hypothetical protein
MRTSSSTAIAYRPFAGAPGSALLEAELVQGAEDLRRFDAGAVIGVHVDPPYDVSVGGDDHGGHRQHDGPVCVHSGQVESKLQLGSPCLVGRLGQEHPPSVDRSGDLDDTTVSFVTIRQSHSLAPLLRGYPQCPHWGYPLAGKITVSYPDREETYQAGDAFYMTPGHVPAAEAGTEFIQFSPKDQLAETVAAMQANAQRAMQGG